MNKENKTNLISAMVITACATGFFVRGRYILGGIGAAFAVLYLVMAFISKKK